MNDVRFGHRANLVRRRSSTRGKESTIPGMRYASLLGVLVVCLLGSGFPFLFTLSFGYGLCSATAFSHAPNSSDHVAYQAFINQRVRNELMFIGPVALITLIKGFSGFVCLASGLIRYFCAAKTQPVRP
jgi:hypothetical protein